MEHGSELSGHYSEKKILLFDKASLSKMRQTLDQLLQMKLFCQTEMIFSIVEKMLLHFFLNDLILSESKKYYFL